jgi:predicted O-methyltransferase YrrM
MTFSSSERAFIAQYLTADTKQLLLKYGSEKQPLIAQIEARQKIRYKLPDWYQNLDLVLPVAVSVEQSSSAATAQHKAQLVSGGLLIDLTGGMGVDVAYFAERFERVIYLEQNPELVAHAKHNFEVLGLKNIEYVCADSIGFLQNFAQKADWIYADPARRAGAERVHRLQDCQPDVVQHLALLLQKAENIMLKTSPLLDLKEGINTLQKVAQIQVVAVQNEVKEVLFLLNQTNIQDVRIQAINLENTPVRSSSFSHSLIEESLLAVELSNPLQYLYEPNAAVLKAGAFKSVAVQFGLVKLAPHSHLYTSEVLKTNFPGRTFEVVAVVKADAKQLMPYLPEGKANLTVRNFPTTVAALRQQLKIKEGGEVYLFATTLANADKRILVCKKPSL